MIQMQLEAILETVCGTPIGRIEPVGVSGVSVDSRTLQTGDIFFAIKGPHFDGHDFVSQAIDKGAACIVVSDSERFHAKKQNGNLVVVENTVCALGRLGSYHRGSVRARVIAVTGSNGKTTTKAMIGHVLCGSLKTRCALRSFNNSIGVPLTLLSAEPEDEWLVVEIGTDSPGEVAHLASLARPDIAVITSIGPAHLSGLGTLEGVAREKLSLLDHIPEGSLAVVNIDQPVTRRLLPAQPAFELVTTGAYQDADLRIAEVHTQGESITFPLSGGHTVTLPIPGKHNALNAASAFAVARHLQIPAEQIVKRFADFKLPDMRLHIEHRGDMTVINDCYNANPASMKAALEVISGLTTPGRRVAIIGDMNQLGVQAQRLHEELGALIAATNIDVLMSVGDYASTVCAAARTHRHGNLELHASKTVDSLTSRLKRLLRPGDTILVKGSRALRLERVFQHMDRN